jgi:hypothetical protein
MSPIRRNWLVYIITLSITALLTYTKYHYLAPAIVIGFIGGTGWAVLRNPKPKSEAQKYIQELKYVADAIRKSKVPKELLEAVK